MPNFLSKPELFLLKRTGEGEAVLRRWGEEGGGLGSRAGLWAEAGAQPRACRPQWGASLLQRGCVDGEEEGEGEPAPCNLPVAIQRRGERSRCCGEEPLAFLPDAPCLGAPPPPPHRDTSVGLPHTPTPCLLAAVNVKQGGPPSFPKG